MKTRFVPTRKNSKYYVLNEALKFQIFKVRNSSTSPIGFSALAAILLQFSSSQVFGKSDTGICHVTENGSVKMLRVSASSLPEHLEHGDWEQVAYYIDADADGAGDAAISVSACSAPFGYVDNALDCDDLDSSIGPGAVDVCGDGIDQDCSNGDKLCSSEIDGWRVTAGPVVDSGLIGYTVAGSFTLERLSDTSALIRNGGACILTDLVDRGIGSASCNSNADCTLLPEYGLPDRSFGYCTKPDGSGEEKRCWTRIGDVSCIRGPQTPGTHQLPPVPEDYTPNDGNPIRWLVLACLAGETNPLACAQLDSPNYVYSVGPVTTWAW